MTQRKPIAASPMPIATGRKAPAFKLTDQDNRAHTLSQYRGQWVVLYFYPKDATPGCTTEACGFRDAHDHMLAHQAVVLGVSPDGAASHKRFADKHGLPFPLLADESRAVCEKYGVWGPKKLYGREYMGVTRTTYLIDPAGKVAQRWDKVKVKQHTREVFEALRALSAP